MNAIGRAAMLSSVLLVAPLFSRGQSQIAPPDAERVAGNSGTLTQRGGQMRVICSGDQLTISANGSPLSTILSEVSRCSGAKIDGAEAAARMRFFETIGPAPIEEVLASLLDATGINYVIQVSDSNPRKIATILLLPRAERGATTGSADDPSTSSGRRALLKQMQQNPRDTEAAIPQDDPVGAVDSGATETRSSDTADSMPDPGEHPQPTTARVPAVAVGSTPASSQMTLQDRIADMQRMFEQRKQMVQDQNTRPH
jgi:hypothetical protein